MRRKKDYYMRKRETFGDRRKKSKFIPILLSVIVIIIVSLFLLPFVFKKQIASIAQKEMNKQLDAKVYFENLNISLFRSFPDANLRLENLYITGKNDFEKDTLLQSKNIDVIVNLKSLFGNSGYEIKKIKIADTQIFAHVLSNGKKNWEIMQPQEEQEQKTESTSSFNVKLDNFSIRNSDIIFKNDSLHTLAKLENINLDLSGNLTADQTILETSLDIEKINLIDRKVNLINGLKLKFDADINANLKEQRYELAENSIRINEIPLSINGWVQKNENSTDVNMTLNSEKVNFKSILSLIPAIYSNSFKGLKADAKINLNGFIKGELAENNFPAFNIDLNVENGWLQYPKLPKSINSIFLTTKISNQGGNLDNTIIDVPKFSLKMDNKPLSASLHLTTPTSDPNFNFSANGNLDLATIKEIYPLEKDMELSGLLNLNISSKGRMSSIEKQDYQAIKFNGAVNIKQFLAKSSQLPKDITIDNANLLFSNQFLFLKNMSVKIGENDIQGYGKVDNYLGYALQGKTLNGNFSFNSESMNLNDFMTENKTVNSTQKVEKSSNNSSKMSVIEIPKNLNLALTGKVKSLKYGKMNFENANIKQLTVQNGTLHLRSMIVNAFEGSMRLSGIYNTEKKNEPWVSFDVTLHQISFTSIFEQVELFGKIAPIFSQATGKFNSDFYLNTSLKEDMTPNLATIISQGSFNTREMQVKNLEVLNAFLKKLNLNPLNQLRNIALNFKIKDGKVETQPFNFKLGNYKMQLAGSTGLDKTINYNGNISLPKNLQYGGLQKVNFNIGGTFTKPSINLDVNETISNIVEEQKEKVVKEVTEKVTQKVETIKKETLDKSREAKRKAIEEARKKSQDIIDNAIKQGNRLIETARISGDSIIAKADNPILKEVAKRTADQLVKKAKEQSKKMIEQAKQKAEKTLEEANKKTSF